MAVKRKLTKAFIDKLPIPTAENRIDYFDSDCKGFGIRVGRHSKRFFVLKRLKGKLSGVMLKP